jgi:hypothetical protein
MKPGSMLATEGIHMTDIQQELQRFSEEALNLLQRNHDKPGWEKGWNLVISTLDENVPDYAKATIEGLWAARRAVRVHYRAINKTVKDNPDDEVARGSRAAIVTVNSGLKNIINTGKFAWGFLAKPKPPLLTEATDDELLEELRRRLGNQE